MKKSNKKNTNRPEESFFMGEMLKAESPVVAVWSKYAQEALGQAKFWPRLEKDQSASDLQNQRLQFSRDIWLNFIDDHEPESQEIKSKITTQQDATSNAVAAALLDFTRMETTSTAQIQMRICAELAEEDYKRSQKYPSAESQILRNKNLVDLRKKILQYLKNGDSFIQIELYRLIDEVLNFGFPAEAIADYQLRIPISLEERESLNDFVDNFLLWMASKEAPERALIFYFKLFCQMNEEEIKNRLKMLGFFYEADQITTTYNELCKQIVDNKSHAVKDFAETENFCFEGEKGFPAAARISTLEQNLYGLDVAMIQRGNFSARNRLGLSVYPFLKNFVRQQPLPGVPAKERDSVREEIIQELMVLILNKLIGFNPRKGAFPLFVLNWIRPLFGVIKRDMHFLRPSRHLVEVLKFLSQNPESGMDDLILKFPRIAQDDLTACLNGEYNFRSMSIDHPTYDSDGDNYNAWERLPQLRYTPNIERQIDDENITKTINVTLQQISPISRAIIEGRILDDKTLREIGQEVGVSHEKIRRSENLFFQSIAGELESIKSNCKQPENDRDKDIELAPQPMRKKLQSKAGKEILKNDFSLFLKAVLRFLR